mgnify:FL=1
MRGADGGPWRRICALPAFWVGLLYDEAALDQAEAMTRDWTYDEVLELRNAVPREGIHAVFRNRSVREIAREVLAISSAGLASRRRLNAEGFDEADFLAPLEEIVARGKTAAEQMLDEFHTIWGASIEPIFLEYAY